MVASFNRGISGDRFQYWHYPNIGFTYFNGSDMAYMGPNQPTAITRERLSPTLSNSTNYQFNHSQMMSAHEQRSTDDSYLQNMELVRVSQNPWMLDSVIFKRHYEKYADDLTVTAAYKLNYMVEQLRVLNNLSPDQSNPAGPGSVWKERNGEIQYRNIYQLTGVEKLPVNRAANIAYKNAEVPTTHFVYYDADTTQPYQEKLFLIQEVWNELGGKTAFTYFPTADTFDLYNSNQQYASTGNQAYRVIGKGNYYRQRYRVESKTVEDISAAGSTTQRTWTYQYDNPADLFAQYRAESNFTNSFNSFFADHRRGFEKVTVYDPAIAGTSGSKTEYYHYNATSSLTDTLIFGKVRSVKTYNAQGQKITESEVDYATTRAYINGKTYEGWQHQPYPPHVAVTPNNFAFNYDNKYLVADEDTRLRDAWFIRPVSESNTVIDPVTGNEITTVTQTTHYDWTFTPASGNQAAIEQDDPDGDYRAMYNQASLLTGQLINPLEKVKWYDVTGNKFAYPLEPSWQTASQTVSTSAMPGAYTRQEFYYLWDIHPLLSPNSTQWDAAHYEYAFRPFYLARDYGIRNTPYETRTTQHNGDPAQKPHSQSTYYWYETFFDVAGDFELFIDTTNHCVGCDTLIGDPIYRGQRQVTAFCFGQGAETAMTPMLSEYIDDPRFVADTSGNWFRFPVVSLKSLTLAGLDSVKLNPSAGVGGTCTAGVVLDSESHPLYFGSLQTGSATLSPDEIKMADANYGHDCHVDSLTESTCRTSPPARL